RRHRRATAPDETPIGQKNAADRTRRFDGRIHAGAARSNDQDIGLDMHGLMMHAGGPFASSTLACPGCSASFRFAPSCAAGTRSCSFPLALARGDLDRLDDLRIRRTTAQITREVMLDFILVGVWFLIQQLARP